MERVQFQQEQMLAELKDLVQKGLFSQKEIKQIMKRRTAFETSLVRRVAKKGDFLRYATYEMDLEALRRKRAERLKLPPSPPSVSDYALVRRQFHIFERALKKFKSDVGLWLQYIQVAKKEGARSLVGRITARALQLHPNVPALYILAAQHELQHLSPSAARTLLQRGIRLNADSVEIWREYVRMEMGFIEGLRRRWSVLGIDLGKDKGKGRASDVDEDQEMGDAEVERMQVDAKEEGDDGDAARREIMNGAIVKSIISNAVKALPKFELFSNLHELITTYPSPPPLRTTLLDHLHILMHKILPSDPAAVKLAATRSLTPDLSGSDLIEALRSANEQLASAVRTAADDKHREGIAAVYAEFVDEWCHKPQIDDPLKAYLVASLHALIQHASKSAPAPLRATHLRLLTNLPTLRPLLPSTCSAPQKILHLARKYTQGCTSSRVWLARLDAEARLAKENQIPSTADIEALTKTWKDARRAVQGAGVLDVWMWGVPGSASPREDDHVDAEAQQRSLEGLLDESMHMQDAPSWSAVHEQLLVRYVQLITSRRTTPAVEGDTNGQPDTEASTDTDTDTNTRPDHAHTNAGITGDAPHFDAAARLARMRHIAHSYLPTAAVWQAAFTHEASVSVAGSGSAHGGASPSLETRVLREVYDRWRGVDAVDASIAWAGVLVRSGRGKEAVEVIGRTRGAVGREERERLERRWRKVVEGGGEGEVEEAGEGEGEVEGV